jgi:hypothetical protein
VKISPVPQLPSIKPQLCRLGVVALLASGVALAADKGGADLNPYQSGVFARPKPSQTELADYDASLALYARKPRRAASVGELIVDENDRTNELVLLADDYNTALRALIPALVESKPGEIHAEDALVLGIENGDKTLIANFGNPIDARYVTDNDRIDDATRELYKYDDPYVRVQRYAVLRYVSIDAALQALDGLNKQLGAGVISGNPMGHFSARQSYEPNDAYYAFDYLNPNYNYLGHLTPTNEAQYQWGLQAMKFPLAWSTSRGHGYIGVLDTGIEEEYDQVHWDTTKFRWPLAHHADLRANYRPQFSDPPAYLPAADIAHGTHVGGILAATTNNSSGVAGACPDCSFAMIRIDTDLATAAQGILKFAQRGVQIINMSFEGDANPNGGYIAWACPPSPGTYNYVLAALQSACDSLTVAASYDVLPVAAAGNFAQNRPSFPARVDSALAVAGAQYATNDLHGWVPWGVQHQFYSDQDDGTNYGGISSVTAPAKRIVSTFPVGIEWQGAAWIKCSDHYPTDESGPPRTAGEAADGYGSCTGTSMASPYIAALAGILRSINPLLTAAQIKDFIRGSADHYHADPNQNDPAIGSGMPDANLAVSNTIATNSSRLTPLFALYSANRKDRFYTTVPQMAAAAVMGSLEPKGSGAISTVRYSPQGNFINAYSSFPGISTGFSPAIHAQADAWIFTTPQNPVNSADPLVPLYRLSWKCGDDTPIPPTAICNASSQQHVDVAYTTSQTAVDAFKNVGYMLDGIEGYIFPKTSPPPLGTVKLLSRYNPSLDDNAIFPETLLGTMTGYTDSSEPDGWLGYVYANSGAMPTIQQAHYVKRSVTFPAQYTNAIRVVCNNALNSYCRLTEVETRDDRNWASASNGAIIGASSTYSANYPESSAIDGDRTGAGWGAGHGGWNDATSGIFGDWLDIKLNGTHVLSSVTVYTLQDNYPNPAEPTDDLTFSAYGLTAFDVQIGDGSSFTTVGSVSGNNLVKRKVTFPPVAGSEIRIVCNNGLAGYSRITEVEARDDRNWGTENNGATASASSTLSALYPVTAIIDGDRKGSNWGNGGGWNNATANSYPQWVQLSFNASHWLSQITVYTLQDTYQNPIEPTDATMFSLYGITAFDVQAWNGASWVTVGTVIN